MKKIIALILACAMVVSLFTACGNDATTDTQATEATTTAAPFETEPTQTIQTATGFAGGDGSEAAPFEIATAEQLAYLHKAMAEAKEANSLDGTYATAYYVLTADIQLNDVTNYANWSTTAPENSWIPLGQGVEAFRGVFDGNGHKITGMYMKLNTSEMEYSDKNFGLFGRVQGTVRNVNLEKTYICIAGDTKRVGGIAGELSLEAVVENCSVELTAELYGNGEAGGIVGSDVGEGVIRNCTVKGALTQMDDAASTVLGGIAGSATSVSGCKNEAAVMAPNGQVGGIASYGDMVENCVNAGEVTGYIAGGIVGNAFKAGTGLELTYTEGFVADCVNEGAVTATEYAGGIVGSMSNSEIDYSITVRNCENVGSISCNDSAAGIVANALVEKGDMAVISCVNRGQVTGTNKLGGILCNLIGGAIRQEGKITISGCTNESDLITEGMYSAGILCYLMFCGSEIDMELTLADCHNTGSITANEYAGGILGYSTSSMANNEKNNVSEESNLAILNCTNSGNITAYASNSFIGGICGNLGAGKMTVLMDGCENTGDIHLDLVLTEEQIQETLASEVTFTLAQILGGMVGRVGEGLFLSVDADAGSSENVGKADAPIVIRNCRNSGTLTTPDYSEYKDSSGRPVWVSFIGGVVGYTCGEETYGLLVEDCTYTGAERGLGNTDYPDVGTKG